MFQNISRPFQTALPLLLNELFGYMDNDSVTLYVEDSEHFVAGWNLLYLVQPVGGEEDSWQRVEAWHQLVRPARAPAASALAHPLAPHPPQPGTFQQ